MIMSRNKRGHTRNKKFLGIPANRRGQMEIIGLVIIVILITVGMLFLAQFALKAKNEKKIFTRKELASSTMTSLMELTIPASVCGTRNPLRMQNNILEECVVQRDSFIAGDPCGSGCNYHCPHDPYGDPLLLDHTCQFFNDTAAYLLEETLAKWGKSYELEISLLEIGGNANTIEKLTIISPRGACPGVRDTSGPFFINSFAGQIESVLYVCD